MSSYQVFARKYRPQTFDSVVGQEHITQTLKNAIATDRLAHAYLFVGPRGTGKTSTARILAKALNCVHGPTVTPCGECDACREIAAGNSLDVMEIDGASNNGVEQVRELRENVRFAPTRGKYKIYIIDEVHMLTTAAFNALLKTLEEPPEHVKFVFATTDVQKVLPTILSRCQRFDLRRIPAELIAGHLQYIAENEKITLEPAAARAIAKGAEGGLRDAESMLDQLVAFCGETIAEADVLSVFGFTASQTVSDLCENLLNGDAPTALGIVHDQAQAGRDLSRLMTDLIGHLRNLLIAKADPEGIQAEVGEEELETLRSQSDRIAFDRLLDLIEQFAAAEGRMKWAPNKKLHFEIAVIKAIQTLEQATLTEVLDTLTALKTGEELPARRPAPAPRPPVVAKPVLKKEPEAPRRSLVAAFRQEAQPASKPEPQPESIQATQPVPVPETKPVAEPEHEPVIAPVPVVEPDPEPESVVPPAPVIKSEPEPAPVQAEIIPEPTPEERAPWEEPVIAGKAEEKSHESAAEEAPEPDVETRSEVLVPQAIPHTLSLFGDEDLFVPEAPVIVPVVEEMASEAVELEPEPEEPTLLEESVEEPSLIDVEEPEPFDEPEIAEQTALVESPAFAEEPALVDVEEPASEPDQAADKPALDLQLWPRLIQEVREKKPLLSSWVEAGALLGIENGICSLGFPEGSGFIMESLGKPTPRQFLEEAISRLTGQPVKLSLELRPGLVVTPVPKQAPKPAVDPMEEYKNDPLIRHALELFKAEIQTA